jgi:antitoxin component YwqK of YwqJK toxin-antitoxin module
MLWGGVGMKKLIYIIFFAVAFSSISNAREIDAGKLCYKNKNEVYEPGCKKLFTGVAVNRYRSGQKKNEKHYENGRQHGLETYWHKNGQKKSATNYKNGKRDGHCIKWHENGQKQSEGMVKENKNEGLWISWHSNGQKNSEKTYRNGKEHGLSKSWWENGTKQYEFNYKDGKRHGLWIYYIDGEKNQEEMWDEDKLISSENF